MTLQQQIQEIRDFLGLHSDEPLELRYVVEVVDSMLTVLDEIATRIEGQSHILAARRCGETTLETRVQALEHQTAELGKGYRSLKDEEW